MRKWHELPYIEIAKAELKDSPQKVALTKPVFRLTATMPGADLLEVPNSWNVITSRHLQYTYLYTDSCHVVARMESNLLTEKICSQFDTLLFSR